MRRIRTRMNTWTRKPTVIPAASTRLNSMREQMHSKSLAIVRKPGRAEYGSQAENFEGPYFEVITAEGGKRGRNQTKEVELPSWALRA